MSLFFFFLSKEGWVCYGLKARVNKKKRRRENTVCLYGLCFLHYVIGPELVLKEIVSILSEIIFKTILYWYCFCKFPLYLVQYWFNEIKNSICYEKTKEVYHKLCSILRVNNSFHLLNNWNSLKPLNFLTACMYTKNKLENKSLLTIYFNG